MRGLAWGVAAVGTLALSAVAFGEAISKPEVRLDRPHQEQRSVGALQAALIARDDQLAQLRAQLDSLESSEARDDALHLAEADRLGIPEAVKASGLPLRTQRRLAAAIVREAKRHQLDPLLVVAVIRSESSFNNYAVSKVGAMGLMQVMPETGRFWAERRGSKLGRPQNLFDAELNIELGASYLSNLITRFGSVDRALVAYNAGPGAARKILGNPTSRARFLAGYPKKVLVEYQRLRISAEKRLAAGEAEKSSGRG